MNNSNTVIREQDVNGAIKVEGGNAHDIGECTLPRL